MKNPSIQLKEVSNKMFLAELQNRLQENKIKEKELAKILTELTFAYNEKELAEAYDEWTNDPNEWKDIKAKY